MAGETKHTPGPWWTQHNTNVMAERESGFGMSKAVVAQTGGYNTNGRDDIGDENEANARLIAASPDLYEVLRDWNNTPGNMRDANWWHEWHRKKDDALAKAEGNDERKRRGTQT